MADAWNHSEHAGTLAGLGIVCFQVLGSYFKPVWIEWNEKGFARRVPAPVEDSSCFRATEANWLAFINGDFNATTGVLRGRIKFRGNLVRILPYASAFNLLAQVARTVSKTD